MRKATLPTDRTGGDGLELEPETADALDQLKQETARELGINLNRAPGEKLSAQDAGRVGGQMVRKLIREYEKANRRPDRSED